MKLGSSPQLLWFAHATRPRPTRSIPGPSVSPQMPSPRPPPPPLNLPKSPFHSRQKQCGFIIPFYLLFAFIFIVPSHFAHTHRILALSSVLSVRRRRSGSTLTRWARSEGHGPLPRCVHGISPRCCPTTLRCEMRVRRVRDACEIRVMSLSLSHPRGRNHVSTV